jgi:radical SAM protein with 4Fe4S-binding SPASM domain
LELKNSGLKNIQISIDSWDPEKWSNMVGIDKRAYSKVLESLKLLKKYHIEIRARITLSKYNLEDLEELLKNLSFFEPSIVRIVAMIPTGRGSMKEVLSMYDTNRALDIVQKYREIGLNIEFGLYKYTETYNHCGGMKHSLFINSQGEVYPCDMIAGLEDHKEYMIGNIFASNIKELWFTNSANKFRYNTDILECVKCDKLEICSSGCRVLAECFYKEKNRATPICSRLYDKEDEFFSWD